MTDVFSDSSKLLLWDLDLKSDRPICNREPGIVSDMDMSGDGQVVLTRSSNTFKSWDLKVEKNCDVQRISLGNHTTLLR
jgi:hypothetical protein